MGSLTTVLLSIFGVLGGALVYAWQKVVDRRETQRTELKSAYLDYAVSINEMNITNLHEDLNQSAFWSQHRSKSQLVELLAPDEVRIRLLAYELAVLEWKSSCDAQNLGGDEPAVVKSRAVKIELVEAIRQDLKRQSELRQYLFELIPFVRPK